MATTSGLLLEEFLRQAETKPYREYVNGEVVQKAIPTIVHGIIQRLLSYVFSLYLCDHPSGEAGTEIRCAFGLPGSEIARVPDVVYITASRLRGLQMYGPFLGAPDLAVEVLSPDDRWSDVMAKLRLYLVHGVRMVWLIDPTARTIMVMRSPRDARILSDQDVVDGGEVLPGFSVPVQSLLPAADLFAGGATSPES